MSRGAEDPPLAELLVRERRWIEDVLRRRGGRLLRFESLDDLVQGVHLRAIESGERFAYQGEKPFRSWLVHVARQHLADRLRYWSALRRRAGRVLRIGGESSTSSTASPVDPPGTKTGPATFAARGEQIDRALEALSALFPRDRDLVRWIADDLSVEEIARRLGISALAAKRARERALARFRRMFELVSRRAQGEAPETSP